MCKIYCSNRPNSCTVSCVNNAHAHARKSREQTYIHRGYLAKLTGFLQGQKNSHFTSLSDCNFLKSVRVHNWHPYRFRGLKYFFLSWNWDLGYILIFLLRHRVCTAHFRAQLARQQTRLQSTHPLPRNVKNRANLTSWQRKPYNWHFDKDVFSACQGGKWTEYQMEHQKLTINSDKLLNWEQKTPASLQNSILSLGTEITHREIRVFNF